MLEKTAASLDPCGLLLPRATKSIRRRRQLHSAFWQHGAADVEFSSAWQALMHGVFNSNTDTTETRSYALRASSLLLDFLYPNIPGAFTRRLGPSPGQSFAKVSPRLYSSSTLPAKGGVRKAGKGKDNGAAVAAIGDSSATQSSLDVAEEPAPDESISIRGDGFDHLEELTRLLTIDSPEDADKVWLHYRALDAETRNIYIGQTLVFLSKTGSIADSWKISELFNRLDPRRWDSHSFVAGTEAELTLQNEQQALNIFAQGLARPDIDVPALVAALDLLLAYAVKSSKWELLVDIWARYDTMAERFEFDGITNQLGRVASVPEMPQKILDLVQYFSDNAGNQGFEILRKLLVRRALVSCTDSQVMPLLRLADDNGIYDQFLGYLSSRGHRKVVLDVYRHYRSLPDCHLCHAALHATFVAFTRYTRGEAQRAGLESVWSDWHTFDTHASVRAYQRFMAFYASKGDKEKVYKLWIEYVELHTDVLKLDDTFTHLLQVHTVRQELSEVQRIFNDISARFQLTPNRHCWNILLNAYVKAGDYEGAIDTFDKIAKAVGADSYTYGTLMQMAASRGDLGFTVDLYRRARSRKIETDEAMLDALISAYCQNDLFHEAEDVCNRAAGRGFRAPRLWNQVLHAYALRRDLNSIDRLLSQMTKMEVPYNEYTYQQLLLGLAFCRQPHHALQLIAVAVKESAFDINASHFHTLMGAFIKTGRPELAYRVHRLMQKVGLPMSSESIVQLATAFGQWHKLPGTHRLGTSMRRLLGAALRKFYAFYRIREGKSRKENGSYDPQPTSDSRLLGSNAEAYQFGRMVYLFTQLKDFTTVRGLIELYRYVVRADPNDETHMDLPMLNSVMLADWYEQKYDRVQEVWEAMFKIAKRGGMSADRTDITKPKVSPTFQYVLSDGLKIMQQMLVLQSNLSGLRALVKEVHSAGFQLDSKNWNLYVQSLVKLKAPKEAFDVCEEWLMPNWSGWYVVRAKGNMKNKIPLDVRRRGTQPRHLRPTAHTFYYLVRGYIEMDKLSPWSPEIATMLKSIERDNPQTHRAIMSMILVHSDAEREILSTEGPISTEDPGMLPQRLGELAEDRG